MASRQCPYCKFYANWGGLALHIQLKHPGREVLTDED